MGLNSLPQITEPPSESWHPAEESVLCAILSQVHSNHESQVYDPSYLPVIKSNYNILQSKSI